MATRINAPRDPNTLSNYNNFVTTHITANYRIDFEKERVSGNTLLKLESVTDAAATEILLDSNFLTIKNVKLDGTHTNWELLPRFEPYGSVLKIALDKGITQGHICELDVCLKSL